MIEAGSADVGSADVGSTEGVPGAGKAPPDPRRWWALGALVIGLLVVGLDTTIINVAMPTMSDQLGATTGDLQWIADSYIVVFAAGMLPAGLIGDRYGRRRFLLVGLGVFAAGSVVGALVGSVGGVIAARALMGVGGAFIMPLSLSILPSLFPPAERAKAISIWAASTALGIPLGPILGGWLLEHFWWGSVFLINIPVVALALLVCGFLLPTSRTTSDAPRIDVGVIGCAVAGLTLLVFAVIEAPDRGWGDPRVLVMFAAGALLVAGVVLREVRAQRPMIDFGLFRDRNFLWATIATLIPSFAMAGVLFLVPQRFQGVDGYNAFGTGLRLLPMLLGLFVTSLASNRLAPRFGHKVVIPAGLFVLGGGLLMGATGSADDGYGWTAAWLTVTGLGVGLSLVPSMDAVMANLAPERTGMGSALVQTLRQVAGAFGVAILGSVLASAYVDRIDTSGRSAQVADTARDSLGGAVKVATHTGDGTLLDSAHAAFVHGMDVALLICAGSALVVGVAVAIFLPRRTDSTRAPATPSPELGESGHDREGATLLP
ncbi:MFS transporter [Streptomyces sp. SID3343]|uniref:MFS transporter n=1 Tax=Streptomyces sp. SID3343 TaxID=2690260 RepID=UPI00136B041F|nr:MFS transporter [Streptomyces sp. SID3343]MYV97602.1 DHA2 family efflux MFS transporter permease subunit [Streptomyces sp. SID3343]